MLCASCSEREGSAPEEAVKDLVTREAFAIGFAATIVCINCGLIFVDPEGYHVEPHPDTKKWDRVEKLE